MLRLCPSYVVDALNGLAQASIWLGRLGEGEANYRAVLALRPDAAEAHHDLGITLYALGRTEEAAASYGQAVRCRPEFAAAYARDGIVFTDQLEAPRASEPPPQPGPVSTSRSQTILITANAFDVRVGGLVVLHKLCYLLRQKGLDARLWMFQGDTKTYFDTPIGNGDVDPRDCVLVYPEVVTGNPLRGKHVIRWLLNTPGFFGVPFMHEPGDLLVSYTRHFSRRYPACEELTVFEAWLDHFKPDPTAYRSGGCYSVRKGHRKRRIPETEGLLELQNYDLESLRQLFTTREVFYSYDAMSFLSTFAALCGCVSIVIPEPNLTKQEWRERCPLLSRGIA
jgi:tetratricopeptide (TPR) repeat protein